MQSAASSACCSQHAATQLRLPCKWSPSQRSRATASSRKQRYTCSAAWRAVNHEQLPERGCANASTSAAADERIVSAPPLMTARRTSAALLALGALAALLHGDAASATVNPADLRQQHHVVNAVFGDFAQNDDFWGNVGAYARFFVTVMLGTVNVVSKPFREAAKRPATAIALGVGGLALFAFMTFTVKLMLGIGEGGDFEYLTRGI